MSSGGTSVVVATYLVDVGGASMAVALTRHDLGDVQGVRIDGAELPASLVDVPGSPLRLLRIGDAVYEIVTERGEGRGSYTLTLDGVRLPVEALDERAQALRKLGRKGAAAALAGPEVIRAPMPGLVSRVLVGPGDTVAAGDGLIVIEAMKMENELRAKSAGRVRSVRATAGTAVEKGAVLVELE